MSKRGTNVYRRKDGRWEARFVEKVGVNGEKKLKSVYGKTYKETLEKRNILMNQLKISVSKEKGLLFCDIAIAWFATKEKELKLSSRERYQTALNRHIIPELGHLQCDDITTEVVNNFIINMQYNEKNHTEEGLSARTIRNIFGILNEIICYARENLKCNIMVAKITLPKLTITHRNVFNPESIHIIASAARKSHKQDLRCLGILICMYTGLRVGELCALKWSDIHLDTGDIYITRTIQRIKKSNLTDSTKKTYLYEGPAKTHKSKREIPICSILKEILREHSELYTPSVYVLSGSDTKCVEPRNFQYFFKRFQESQCLPPLNCHALRHTFASMGISMGMDAKTVSELLGHSNVNITLNCYVHISTEEKRKQIELISKL